MSVVIPVFNGQAYLAEALKSVADQSVRDLEVIVVDDGSSDATADIVHRSDDPRVRYVRQDRSGAAAARNHGVDQARGRLIAFLDADDLWTTDKLQLQIASLDAGAGDLVFAHVDEFISPDCRDELEGTVKPHHEPASGIIPSALLMRRDSFDRVGPLDVQWQLGEFIEWYARAVDLRLKPFVLPDVLVRRRIHRDNQGRRNRAQSNQYAQILKGILDRRRANC